jgi:hypothetical protein
MISYSRNGLRALDQGGIVSETKVQNIGSSGTLCVGLC